MSFYQDPRPEESRMPPSLPVTVMVRVDQTNPGHTWLSVFVGRNVGARGFAGHLVLRTDELAELLAQGWWADAPEVARAAITPGRQFEVGVDYAPERGDHPQGGDALIPADSVSFPDAHENYESPSEQS